MTRISWCDETWNPNDWPPEFWRQEFSEGLRRKEP